MLDKDPCSPTTDGVRTGPDFIVASNGNAPTVLPTSAYIVKFLEEPGLKRLNVIQLAYARKVAEAQAVAYGELLSLLGEDDPGSGQ